MKTADRRALVDRFRERNPAPPGSGSEWQVNEEALTLSLTVVDPFRGFLRRAKRGDAPRAVSTTGPIGEGDAAIAARAFVKKNADLLGLPIAVAVGLAEQVRQVEPGDHAAPRATWAVRLDAPFPSKGFEGFHEIDNVADILVFVDDDGEISSFVNVSRIHPRLTLDTKPGLAEDDGRVIAQLVGRTVFALIDDRGHAPSTSSTSSSSVRELRRVPLGKVTAQDVTHVQLVVHVSTGPQLAWLTYRLAYFIEVARPAAVVDPSLDDLITGPPSFFFFRYVVDADTGDVVEDARAPVTASATAFPPP